MMPPTTPADSAAILSAALNVETLRELYSAHTQIEHGTVMNPISGEEIDIMKQCVNLELGTGADAIVGDLQAYSEVIATFSEVLPQGLTAWVKLHDKYKKGKINRVNNEEDSNTYDFQYDEIVPDEKGKMGAKTFIVKDLSRLELKTQQVLVKGDPAAGKTTFAKQLLTWIMRRKDSTWLVPVIVRTVDLVRFRDLWDSNEGAADMIDQFLKSHFVEEHYNLFLHARQAGRLLVILDGFDEAGPLEGHITKQISEMLNNSVFLVLTSRDMGHTFSNTAFDRFLTVRVRELNKQQQRQVVCKRLVDEEKVADFCKQLELNPSLDQMAKNPLLLNITLSVFETNQNSKTTGCKLQNSLCATAQLNRGKVYQMALDGMLGAIEQTKMPGSLGSTGKKIQKVGPGTGRELRAIFKRVAFTAHAENSGRGIRDFSNELVQRAVEACGLPEFKMEDWENLVVAIKKGRLPLLSW